MRCGKDSSFMHDAFLKALVRCSVPRPLRNWLRSPSKSAEWMWDTARYSFGITKTLTIPPDVCIAMHPHAYKVACKAQIAEPEESAEFQNFISYCNRGMLLFDVGAHYGLFSLAAAHFGGQAVAVDPSAMAIRMIARQIALNHAADKYARCTPPSATRAVCCRCSVRGFFPRAISSWRRGALPANLPKFARLPLTK
jgi:hypothetical protein